MKRERCNHLKNNREAWHQIVKLTHLVRGASRKWIGCTFLWQHITETPPARARNHKPRGAVPTCPYRAILISGHTYSWLWISVVHLRRSSVANKQDVLARKRVGLHNSQLAMIRKCTKKQRVFGGSVRYEWPHYPRSVFWIMHAQCK